MYLLYFIVLDFLNAFNFPEFDSVLESNKTYLTLSFLCFVLPIIFWLLFYKFYSYPYAKLFHWISAFAILLIIVGILSYASVNEALLGANNSGIDQLLASNNSAQEIADSLPLYLSIYNVFLSAILGFVYSIFLKRFSKVQMHLPF